MVVYPGVYIAQYASLGVSHRVYIAQHASLGTPLVYPMHIPLGTLLVYLIVHPEVHPPRYTLRYTQGGIYTIIHTGRHIQGLEPLTGVNPGIQGLEPLKGVNPGIPHPKRPIYRSRPPVRSTPVSLLDVEKEDYSRVAES